MNTNVHTLLEEFFSHYAQQTFQAGHIILPAFSAVPGVYFVAHGLVQQYTLAPDGREFVVNLYKPGSFFPMITAVTGKPNAYFFEAIQESTVYRAPIAETLAYLQRNPAVMLDLLTRLYSGLDGLLQQATFNVIGTARQKVIATLVMYAKRFGEGTHEDILLPLTLTHKQIGLFSGTSRESVTRVLGALQTEGLVVAKHHQLCLPNLDKLEQQLFISQD